MEFNDSIMNDDMGKTKRVSNSPVFPKTNAINS